MFGKPYLATPQIIFGISSLDHLQSGQWVKVAGQRRASRFVRERKTGNMYVVTPPSGGRVSMKAFLLSVGVEKPKVVKLVSNDGKMVKHVK